HQRDRLWYHVASRLQESPPCVGHDRYDLLVEGEVADRFADHHVELSRQLKGAAIGGDDLDAIGYSVFGCESSDDTGKQVVHLERDCPLCPEPRGGDRPDPASRAY